MISTDDYFSLTDRFYTHTDLTDFSPNPLGYFLRMVKSVSIRVYPCAKNIHSWENKHSFVGDYIISVREFHRMSQQVITSHRKS